MLESSFAQMCNHLNMKSNYAQSYKVLVVRLSSKLYAMAIPHSINYINV
jgi:hypothetical protein